MIIEREYEFAEFEHLPEFVQQYMNYTIGGLKIMLM